MSPRVDETIVIDAPPERVWEVVMDPHCLGQWVTAHREVREVPEGELRKGSSFDQTLCVAGRSFDVTWTLAESRRPQQAEWNAVGPRKAKAQVSYGFSERDGGTCFEYANEFELPSLLRIVGGRVAGAPARRAARKSLRNLKRLVESRKSG